MSRPALSAALGRLARAADPDPPADGRLVARFARTRDPDAFAELVRRVGPMVLGVCRRVTGDSHLADDAFQAAFLVLARRAADVNPADAVRGWMYGVAVRVAREARSVSARRRAREAPVPTLPDRAADPYQPPDADALRALDEEVAALPDHVRAAVVLCELDGVSRKDAAGRLGVPEGTVSSRLAKGRRLLADRLRKRGVAAPGLAALAPAVVPARLTAAASALATGAPAPGVAALAHGVVRAMLLQKFRVVPLAVGLFAAVALAAGSSPGQPDVPRPAPAPLRVAAQPPAAKAAPVGLVVTRRGPYWRLDPDGKKLGEIAAPEKVQFGDRVAVSPDGTRVAIAASAEEAPRPPARVGEEAKPFPLKLVVVPLAGGEPKVIDLPAFTLEPRWLPDGKALMVAQATNPGRTAYKHVTVDAATGAVTPHGDGEGLRILDVSRDGRTFLCEQRDAAKKTAKLVLSRAGDGGIESLTDLKTPSGSIVGRFSPDGTRVLFTDGDPARKDAHKWGASHRPYLLDLGTKARAPLADFPENGRAGGVAWAPDGKRVAYTWGALNAEVLAKDRLTGEDVRVGTEGFVMVADADGRNARTVATETGEFANTLVFGGVEWR